jgi:hypothetical protein
MPRLHLHARRHLAGMVILLGVLALPGSALAQRGQIATTLRFDMTVGGGLVSGVSLGERDANLRANASRLEDYRLFTTTTELRAAPVVDVRLAGELTGRIWLEGQVQFGQPKLEATVSDDVEGAADVTVTETLTQLLAGGGVRVRLDNMRRQTRVMPYASAGAAVLRQTPQGGFVEQSPVLYVGAGVRQGLSPRQGFARVGVRADVQLLMVKGGLKADDTFTPQLSLTGGVFFAF